MMNSKTGKYIFVTIKNPNSLFIKWLKEWLENVDENNLELKNNINEAITSLKKFPLPLNTGRDCIILKGFDSTLCKFLDEKLHLRENENLSKHNKCWNKNANIKTVLKSHQNVEREYCTSEEPISSFQTQRIGKTEKDSFKVILLVDTQETRSLKKVKLLESDNIQYEIRRLNVGDFCWIYRDNQNNEYVLPYVVERKRLDDFASSIRDGRFHEQKFRLQNYGFIYLIYLIEDHGNKHLCQGLTINTLMQAATNTQIHNEFQLKFTENYQDSILYISTLTKILMKKFENKDLNTVREIISTTTNLRSKSFNFLKYEHFFNKSTVEKQRCVKNIFIKQLLQMKSLSIDKALSIIKIYPTPYYLISAYANRTQKDGRELLVDISCKQSKNSIGILISKVMHQLYDDNFKVS